MSIVVHQCIVNDDCCDNFVTGCERPPVPGRENDQQQLSSGSALFKQPNTPLGEFANQPNVHGQFGVPRHSHSFPDSKARNFAAKVTKLDPSDCTAPLGFEPEGSVNFSRNFRENANTSGPSCFRWAESFASLLEDSDGVKLFQEFLKQEYGCSDSLDFWFACRGMKMVKSTDFPHVVDLVRLICKKFIKGDGLHLKSEIKRKIIELYKQKCFDQEIFNEAQAEIENSLRNDSYPLFLKSDIYLQYIQSETESPRLSSSSSEQNSAQQSLGISQLPTLHEGEELGLEDIKNSSKVSSLSLTPLALYATRKVREGLHPNSYCGISFPTSGSKSRLSNPYHVSYAPVSAQDSELQSLSSDALTDETKSYTSSSHDGREQAGSYLSRVALKKHFKTIRHYADTNQQADLNQKFIPRTERVPVDSNLAETDPHKFASTLCDRLQRVKDEQDKMDHLNCSIYGMECVDDRLSTSLFKNTEQKTHHLNRTVSSFPFASALLASTLAESDFDDNAQSILDDHVSHVWSSSGPTPSRSPGVVTPDRNRRNLIHPLSSATNSACPKTLFKQKSSGPLHSTSYTSGVSHQVGGQPVPGHKQGQRHQRPGMKGDVDLTPVPVAHHFHGISKFGSRGAAAVEDLKRTSNRRLVDPLKTMETSGIVGVSHGNEVRTSDQPHVNTTDSANKVLMWMLESDKCSGNKPRYSTDGSDKGSSHKRSSHKSSHSGSRKDNHQKMARSESLDRSRLNTGSLVPIDISFHHRSGVVQPSHIIAQDLSMPLMTPPNPATQLEEAKRRLDDETRAVLKSRSFIGNQSSSWKVPPQSSAPLPTSTNIPFLNPSTSNVTSIPSSLQSAQEDRRSENATTQPGSKSTSTVVGYYFCDETIPYRITLSGTSVTLGQFKHALSKKGNFRFYFKKVCDEFDSGIVHEEISSDNEVLPLFEGKVICKIERAN